MDNGVEVLLKFIAENGQAIASSKELRQQLSTDLDAVAVKSKAATKETTKAVEESASAVKKSSGVVKDELNQTNLSFASTARSVSSLGRGIESALSGNILSALRNFGAFSRSAFSTTGPLTYAESLGKVKVATEEVAVAEEGAAAATATANAGFALSGTTIGLLTVGVGLLAFGIYKLITSEQELIFVGKEEIEVTQKRVEVARQELDLAQRVSASTDDERARRQALIETKRQELAINLSLQKEQEANAARTLIEAVKQQQDVESKLIAAQELERVGVFKLGSATDDLNKKRGEAIQNTEKARESLDILSAATGKSREQILVHNLALLKHTDALGLTHHLYEDVAHAAGYLVDAQGRLVTVTDSATAALDRQTDALRRQTSALQARGRLADAVVQKNIADIINEGFKGQAAVEEFKRRQNTGGGIPFLQNIFGPTLGQAVDLQKQQEAAQKAIDEYLKPPKGRKARTPRDDQGRPDIKGFETDNKAVIEKMRADLAELKAAYDQGAKDREDYYAEAQAQLKVAHSQEVMNLDAEVVIATAKIKNQKDLNLRLKEIKAERQKIDDEFEKNKREFEAKRQKDELESTVANLQRIDETLRYYENRQLAEAEAAFKRGAVTEADLEQVKYEQKDEQLKRRLELLKVEQQAWGVNSEKYKEIVHQEEMIDAERLDRKEDYVRKMTELMIRESDPYQGLGRPREAIKGTGVGTGRDSDFYKQIQIMNEQLGKPPDWSPWKSGLEDLKSAAVDTWGSITQSFGSMIEALLIGGNKAEFSFAKVAKAAIASVAAQADVRALFEWGMYFATLWLNPLEAHTHLLAAQEFTLVGAVATGIAAAIPGGGSGGGSGAGGGSGSGGPQSFAPFNYGSQNFSASQANAPGSRTEGIFGQLLNEQRQTNQVLQQLQPVSAGFVVGMGAPEAPHAIGSAVQSAIQSGHPVKNDITSLGSTGLA